jgi:membrane associated rhomboid family serine protease
MFLHGGWFHIISNMWILFIFGDNVEDRMGSGRYLLFYLISGLAAAFVQVLTNPASQIPAIGASGAIAGVLGAYFLLYPRSRVITLIPIFFIPWIVEIPAIFYLGFWFVSQLFSGVAALRLPQEVAMGGVAWWAHIGGFVFGIVFYRLFTPRRHRVYTHRYPDEYFPW